ncbi:hypothetical protein [Nannocystis radixulma]|uniref:TIR domain-containing protein n=1 Tax=Nannocystis radixulma TaxID=2995305 RepID=A0ABT5BE55_9BACT|nr:hypothetical protein [Nannocystis radixulma]MDC0672437.1 hypothetical protein [Nannocystis radixulma]
MDTAVANQIKLLEEFSTRYKRYLQNNPQAEAQEENHRWLLRNVQAVQDAVDAAGNGGIRIRFPNGQLIDPFLVFLNLGHGYFAHIARAVHEAVERTIGYYEHRAQQGISTEESFEIQKPNPTAEPSMEHRSPAIFLSHAHCDKSIIREIVNFLKNSMVIHDSQIRCTSISGHKLEYGRSIDSLRQEIAGCKVFLQFLSSESQSRPNVIMELGAAWVSEKPLFILLGRNVPFHATGFVSNNHHLRVEDVDFNTDIKMFVNQIASLVECDLQSDPSRDRARDALVTAIESLPQVTNAEETSSPITKLRRKVQALIDSLDPGKSVVGHDIVSALNRHIATAKQLIPDIQVEPIENPRRGPGTTFGLSNLTPVEIRARAGELLAELT